MVYLASLLVPSHRRDSWRRQWEAELAYVTQAGSGTLRYALGSFAHAVDTRRQEAVWRGLGTEFRQSVRGLARRPAFAVFSVLTLGAGIGVATAIFSLAEAMLFRPLPVEEGARLVELYSSNPTHGMERFSVSFPDFEDWTSRTDLFESASLYWSRQRDLSGSFEPERIDVAEVHRGFFETLKSRLLLGRPLLADDQQPNSEAVAVLAESLWRGRYGADSAIVGSEIRLDGVAHTVVGVLAAEQGWPARATVWVPLRFGNTPPEWAAVRSNHTWQVVARLQPGVSVGVASAQVRDVARTIYSDPIDQRDVGTEARVVPLRPLGTEGGPQLFTILGVAVLLVLLIASLNQSGLLLAHTLTRSRELSLRTALGASRRRIVALLLGESVVLAGLGGVVGLVLARAGTTRILALAPAETAAVVRPELNLTVVAGAVVISALASILAGLVPALRGSRHAVADAMKEGATQSSQGLSGRRIRRGLVVLQLAFSVVLLASAGLAIRSFRHQLDADPGFPIGNVLTFSVRLPNTRYAETAAVDRYYHDARARLESIPGVNSATSTSLLPVGGPGLSLHRVFLIEGQPEPPEGVEYGASWVEVSPEFFETLGVRPVRGRTFTLEDRDGSVPVMIVTESLARRMSEEVDVLGQRVRSWRDEDLLREVVGVVPDIQFDGIAGRDQATVFVPQAQSPSTAMAFMVRTVADPLLVVPLVRSVMKDLDGDVALHGMETLDGVHRADLAPVRFIMTLFATFGLLALVLSLSGVYGLMAHSVSQRTREIGIRMALGAPAGKVRGQVLAEAGALVSIGLGLGTVLALAFARVISFGLFGVSWFDPRTFVGVGLLLAVCALLAGWLPALRATRVSPVDALRID